MALWPDDSRAGQPGALFCHNCGGGQQEPRVISSVTPGTGCGKKSHTLIEVVGVCVVEVEPIAFGHAIQAAAVDPEDLRSALLIALGGA